MGKIPEETLIKKYGSVEAYKESLNRKLAGKHFYTNGIVDIKLSDDEDVPDGFYRGRTNGCGCSTIGKVAINDGKITKFIEPEEAIPEGFTIGSKKHSKVHNKKISQALTGKERSKSHCINLSKSHKTESYKNKIKSTLYEKYGVINAFQLEKAKAASNSQESKTKRRQTLKKNNSFNTSKLEVLYKNKLEALYGEADVCTSYSSDLYPFSCDFYIKSLNLYIEIHGFWTHGKHPYNPENKEDFELASSWKNSDNKFYQNAYINWVERDVIKLKCMKDNNLNYIIIYNDMYITNIEDEICQKIVIKN